MRRYFSLFLVLFLTLNLVSHDAFAKRFGGGRSFGASRSTSSSFFRNTNTSSRASAAQLPNQKPSLMSRLAGPAMGLLLGTALASLFMGHGVGTGILSWIILAGVIMLLINLVRGFSRPRPSAVNSPYQYQSNQSYQQANDRLVTNNQQPPFFQSNLEESQPVDHANLMREAKALFIRMQAAYDAKNLADIRQFTSPEVFAEIQLQLQERGNATNVTEVVQLDAEILDANEQGASIHFSGLIKENVGEMPQHFKETWYLDRDATQGKWIVAGVQQG